MIAFIVLHILKKVQMPDNSLSKDTAYQVISDELMLDGKPRPLLK